MFEELVKRALNYFTKRKEHHTDIYKELMIECEKAFTKEEVALIKKAYETANYLHRNQKRNSGEPYIIHPLYVAYIALKELNLHEANSIAACLLHDTVEDCNMTEEQLIKYFNKDIAELVMGVTKINNLNCRTKEEREAYNYRLLLLDVLKNYRIILIKIADRLHNMRTLEYKEEPKRIAKSAETLRIFVPLANHIGASLAKEELADLSLQYLNDRGYREIDGMRKDYSLKHQDEVEYELNLFQELLKEIKIPADIRVSLKNKFSIYQYLTEHHKISEIPNLLRYSIMVDTEEECKVVKEAIKKKFQVLEEYTKDYISNPKPNGYQAIHLSIPGHKISKIDPNHPEIIERISKITGEKIPIQIQIFTKEMFLVNSYGFAALLDIYPDKSMPEIQAELLENNSFFKALQENKTIIDPFLFIEKTVRELLSDKITVFDADGVPVCLPAVSTVIDFADKIHSEIRQNAVSAIVNGIEVDLNFPLKDNDRITILTKDKLKALNRTSPTLALRKKETFQ